jgi:hypothetical protein
MGTGAVGAVGVTGRAGVTGWTGVLGCTGATDRLGGAAAACPVDALVVLWELGLDEVEPRDRDDGLGTDGLTLGGELDRVGSPRETPPPPWEGPVVPR